MQTLVGPKGEERQMISKSAAEYRRRKCILRDGLNHRESGRIRYQNQHTILSKQDEAPGMAESIVFTPNIPELPVRLLPTEQYI